MNHQINYWLIFGVLKFFLLLDLLIPSFAGRKEEERGGSQLRGGFYWKNEQIGSLMFSGRSSDLCLDFSSPWCGRFLVSFDGTLHAGAPNLQQTPKSR